MRDLSIAVIQSWPPPNYVNPVTRGPELIWVNAFFISMVGIVVALRLYVRIFMLRFGWDDVLIIFATLSAIGMTTCAIVAYEHFGWDRHIWDLPMSHFNPALKLAWWTKIVYSTAACFTRMSLLLFYYRLTKETGMRWFRWCLHLSVFVSLATGISLVLLVIFQCKPISAFWTYPPMPGQKCLDEGYKTLGCGVANTIADLLVVILPIPMIAKLRLPLRQRVGAILLVSLGFVVCITSAVRAYFTWLSLIQSYDETWDSYGIYISAAVEIDIGVICACAPTLRLVIIDIIQPRFSSLTQSWTNHSIFSSSRNHRTKRSNITESSGSAIQSVSSYDTRGLPDFEMIPSKAETTIGHKSGESTLREKGFIVTSGSTRDVPVLDVLDKEMGIFADDDLTDYFWDEPWTGPDGARPQTLNSALAPGEIVRETTPVSQRYEVAVPVKILEHASASKKPIIPDRAATGFGLQVVEQKGVGILPDYATIPETTTSTGKSIFSVASDDITLPIQGVHDPPSPRVPMKPSSALQIPTAAHKPSRIPLFDFEYPFHDEKKVSNKTDPIEDNQDQDTNETLPTPVREYVQRQHAHLWQAVSGGDRIRILHRRERTDGIGRPSSSKGT